MNDRLTFTLVGDSKQRRKQYRKIIRDHPDYDIKRFSFHTAIKRIGNEVVTVEDANELQTRGLAIPKLNKEE